MENLFPVTNFDDDIGFLKAIDMFYQNALVRLGVNSSIRMKMKIRI